jgi:hypothetical protein
MDRSVVQIDLQPEAEFLADRAHLAILAEDGGDDTLDFLVARDRYQSAV